MWMDAVDGTWASCMHGKFPTCWTILLAPVWLFLVMTISHQCAIMISDDFVFLCIKCICQFNSARQKAIQIADKRLVLGGAVRMFPEDSWLGRLSKEDNDAGGHYQVYWGFDSLSLSLLYKLPYKVNMEKGQICSLNCYIHSLPSLKGASGSPTLWTPHFRFSMFLVLHALGPLALVSLALRPLQLDWNAPTNFPGPPVCRLWDDLASGITWVSLLLFVFHGSSLKGAG